MLLGAPTFPGCHIAVRVVALFEMTDESGPDAKLVVVPAKDPRWQQVRELEDVNQFLRDEISQFFEVYKLLEPGKHSRIEGWRGRIAAERELQAAYDRFADG